MIEDENKLKVVEVLQGLSAEGECKVSLREVHALSGVAYGTVVRVLNEMRDTGDIGVRKPTNSNDQTLTYILNEVSHERKRKKHRRVLA